MTNQLTAAEHTNLWDSFREGDSDAFAKLYELFVTDLYRYGYNLVRNKLLVEDCLHELFLYLHENRSRLGPTNNIRFYLYRALRRRLFDAVSRLNKLDSEDYTFDRAEFQILPHEHNLIENQLQSQQKELLINELDKLPKRQKEILYLVYMQGLTYQQAAEVMDITLKSVYNTISVAITSLRVCVRQSFKKQGVLWSVLLFGAMVS